MYEIEDVLNRVCRVGLVGNSCGSKIWVKVVDNSNSGIDLVGQSRGSNSWVIFVHQTYRSNS